MWSNLYRLRLLDFFELTAATGAALYIYKSNLWWEFEKNWIAAALAISAILIWVTTRIGKTKPTPGLFLAAYTGALYGLSDLSPWMMVLGRLPVLETMHHLFPDTAPLHGLQARLTVIALTSILIAVPALLFGSAAASAGMAVSMIRKTWKWPTSLTSRAAIILHGSLTLTFLVGLSYYSLRPQIRHVATIRIPIEPDPHDKSGGQSTNYFRATSVIAWSVVDKGKSIVAVRSDSKVFEFGLPTGRMIREFDLNGEPIVTSRRYFIHEGDITEARKSHLSDGPNLGHVHRSTNREGRRILLVIPDFFGPPYQFFDAVTGEKLPLHVPLSGPSSYIVAKSTNGRFALFRNSAPRGSREEQFMRSALDISQWIETDRVNPTTSTIIEESGESTPADFTLTDLESLHPIAEYSIDPNDGPIVDSTDGRLSIIKGVEARRRRQFLLGQIGCIRGEYPGRARLSRTNDGKWQLSPLGLESSDSDEKLLVNYMQFDLHAVLDPTTGRVALTATPNDNHVIYTSLPTRIPIIEGLLQKAQNGQITLFDPKTKSASTSWLRLGILKNHHPDSAKFTEDGRYLILQDEDETADLFHVFAMP